LSIKEAHLEVRINDTVKVIPLIDNMLLADSAKVVAKTIATVLHYHSKSQTNTEKEQFAKTYLQKQGWL